MPYGYYNNNNKNMILRADLETASDYAVRQRSSVFFRRFPAKFSADAHTTRGYSFVVGDFFLLSRASHSLFRPLTFLPVTQVRRKNKKKKLKNSDSTPFFFVRSIPRDWREKNCRIVANRQWTRNKHEANMTSSGFYTAKCHRASPAIFV